MTKYYFENSYTGEMYIEAIKQVYKVSEPRFVLSPCLHETKNTLGNYLANGVRRFLK